jgi:hypothetical protein
MFAQTTCHHARLHRSGFFVPLWVLVEIFRFSLIVRSPVMGKAQTLAG